MAQQYQRVLHLFRRDLRLEDNTALIEASAAAREVLCAFVFDPRQVEPHPYRSLPALQFMLESLDELATEIEARGGRLRFLYGDPLALLPPLLASERIEALFFNRDYTPFARNRDRALKDMCDSLGIKIHQWGDALLQEPEAVHKQDGSPYSVYTPFAKCASQLTAVPVRSATISNLGRFKEEEPREKIFARVLPTRRASFAVSGGRSVACKVLTQLERYKNYAEERDIPGLANTTLLSPHLKFGTVSAREVFDAVTHTLGKSHVLIRELWWRDFFTHIAFHYPHVFKGAFHSRYDALQWENRQDWFQAWCEGRTGFPIVDAGMRQLNETGFMHNRVRMVVASFLTKDLLIDWRWGERYFATKLLDYDPAVNNGNWQWAASTGCDAQPYFRVFNPWLQQQKFDSNVEYVKRWVPELRALSAKEIHLAYEKPLSAAEYPRPIVDHAEQKQRAVRLYEEVRDAT